jgi:hypothetical protein
MEGEKKSARGQKYENDAQIKEKGKREGGISI